MISKPKKTRPATAAERLAARALGKPEPTEVEVETRSSGERHLERLQRRQFEHPPAGTSVAEWHGRAGDEDGDGPPTAA